MKKVALLFLSYVFAVQNIGCDGEERTNSGNRNQGHEVNTPTDEENLNSHSGEETFPFARMFFGPSESPAEFMAIKDGDNHYKGSMVVIPASEWAAAKKLKYRFELSDESFRNGRIAIFFKCKAFVLPFTPFLDEFTKTSAMIEIQYDKVLAKECGDSQILEFEVIFSLEKYQLVLAHKAIIESTSEEPSNPTQPTDDESKDKAGEIS